MFSDLFRSICQVGVFMICAQAIVHFRPKGSYEKYLKVLVSVMILIQIFLPIGRLFSKDIQTDVTAMVREFEQKLNRSMTGVEQSVASSEKYAGIIVERQLDEMQREQPPEEGQTQEDERKVEKIQIKVGQ
ncbi:MAG: hypothetical protein E7287_00640 [Lachnospiraceae bacterium]|nr:hypothetical protein [Lachnospiraceae bacterium]